MKDFATIDALQDSLRPLRIRIAEHEVYRRIETLQELQLFMEHHVFAVWDFMSLLKALQHRLTCVTVPWMPQGDRLGRRLINEIVLEEESDENASGGYISHFELYRAAMEQCGADTSRVDAFLGAISRGEDIEFALALAETPPAARHFVTTTMRIAQSESTHAIAAAFTVGREDVVPVMFKALFAKLHDRFLGKLTLFQDYLDRHIKLDEERHSPMAIRMLMEVCGQDQCRWREAEDAARSALTARIALWDEVLAQIARTRSTCSFPLRKDCDARTL